MVSYRQVKSVIGRIQPVAWITVVAGLAFVVALNHTLTQLYSDLDLLNQLIVLFVLIVILSITGYRTAIEGLLKPRGKG